MPNQSRSASTRSYQINLRIIFLVLSCASVGLTCASAPTSPARQQLQAMIGSYVADFDLHYALLMFVAAAMVVGLIQQLRALLAWKPDPQSESRDIRFARLFAIAWRIVIALTITICIIAQILILRQVVSLPIGDDQFTRKAFPDALLEVAMIVVLSDSIRRRREIAPKPRSRKYDIAASLIGLVLALLVLPEAGFVTYLIHIGTQNIEHAQPLKFQRLGTFPDQLAGHFHVFWMSLAAAIAVALAAFILVVSNRVSCRSKTLRACVVLTYAALLASCIAFCAWFHSVFPNLSPDLASTGFVSNWFDIGCAAFFVGLVSCVFAYRISTTAIRARVTGTSQLAQGNVPAFHESPLCLFILAGSMTAYFIELVREANMSFLSAESILVFIGEIMRYTSTYIPLAIMILTLQLIYLRWKQRGQMLLWNLQGVSLQRFSWNFVAMSVLFAVAIPTLTIYCFTFWLGPWYFYTPQ